MKVFYNIPNLQKRLDILRAKKSQIGFVPTMGAIHQGHLSLVKLCKAYNDICVVSIFVNPTQFDDPDDLLHYPKTLRQDCYLLKKAGCDAVFAPSVEEMYPEPDHRTFRLGSVQQGMEADARPGHFDGVAQIVSKLFNIVQPRQAFFGEKDFQQLAVVKALTKHLNLPIEIISVPIQRDHDGLALSSRNGRLSEQQRTLAPKIFQTLNASTALVPKKSVKFVEDWVTKKINNVRGLDVEYFTIVNPDTLVPISRWKDHAVGCIAVHCGNVRLIDNITYQL
jgi:pantoate--beta-alanine ligase